MYATFRHFALATLALTLTPSVVAFAAPPDTGQYTNYVFNKDFTKVDYFVCQFPQGGCWGGDTLGPFGHVGAMLEGIPSYPSVESTERGVYLVDIAAGNNGDQVILYRYVETYTFPYSVTYILAKSISLPLIGGAGARCFMVANRSHVYIGTNQSSNIAQVAKASLELRSLPGNVTSDPVTSMTVDGYGDVVVTGRPADGSPGSFVVYDAAGDVGYYGGGQAFVLSTVNGLSTSDLPIAGYLD